MRETEVPSFSFAWARRNSALAFSGFDSRAVRKKRLGQLRCKSSAFFSTAHQQKSFRPPSPNPASSCSTPLRLRDISKAPPCTFSGIRKWLLCIDQVLPRIDRVQRVHFPTILEIELPIKGAGENNNFTKIVALVFVVER